MSDYADLIFDLVLGVFGLLALYWAFMADIHSGCHHYKRGWYCTRDWGHDGPCALKPRWWNLYWVWRMRS